MFEQVAEILANQLGISKDKVTLESEIIKDLGADSLDVFELLMALQDETGKTIPDDKITTLKTVGDVVNVLETL
ncbi:MAG: acyl carrier protein [Clostridia bacterium]|nr:acyl carrier protein [Clostridia bacterium]